MVQLKPGDVIAFQYDNEYYYSIILTKIIYFGGNLVYAFHLGTDKIITLDELLKRKPTGFNAIVDFIFAKRENRIKKLGITRNYDRFWRYRYFKATHAIEAKKEKSKLWFIYDDKFKELRRVESLSEEEKKYPENVRIDDTGLKELIQSRWLPEKDPRI